MDITLRINYKGGADVPTYIQFTTSRSLEAVLEDIGKATATGGLYSITDNGHLAVAIPGRRIETIEQVV